MSSNLDLVRSILADWERGDFGRSNWADAGIEYVIADGPDPGTTSGLRAMAQRAGEQLRPSKNTRLAAREVQELDGRRVLARISSSVHGKSSGIQVQFEQVHVFSVRDGKVIRLVVYYEPGRAFADVGLTPGEKL